MENYSDIHEHEIREIAKRKLKKLKSFYIHTLIFALAISVYALKKYFGFSFNFFPFRMINGFFIAIWATVWLILATDMFISTFIIGKRWEERQLKRFMQKETKRQIWK